MLCDEFPQDAPHRPHLYRRVVLGLHEDELGGPVPPAHHVAGHEVGLLGVLLVDDVRQSGEARVLVDSGPGQAEVADLYVVVEVAQDILRLQVPVQYFYGAQVFQGHQDLVDDFGDVLVAEDLVFGAELPQVEGEVLEDDRQRIVVVEVVGGDDVEELYDVFVVDPAEDGQFPQGPEGQDAVGEYLLVFFDGVDLFGLLVSHFVDFSVGT